MREYISKKLGEMKNLEEKELLRSVLEQVFLPLYDETIAKYDTLEQRVKNEIGVSSQEYAIYSTILPKDKADEFASWLHPIIMTDESPSKTFSANMFILDTVYLEADYLICRELNNSGETFQGFIYVDENKYSIEIKLKPAKRYVESVSVLYRHFINNGIPWVSLNIPYIHKMFDIVITKSKELETVESGSISQIHWEISFGQYDKYVKKDFVPVWNIETFIVKDEGFPTPVIDKKNYEYFFNLEEYGQENGYLANYDFTPIIQSRRENNKFIVSVPEKKEYEWNFYKIAKPIHSDTITFPYPIFSNQHDEQFAYQMVTYFGSRINTKAEIKRIIQSYNTTRCIKINDMKIVNNQSIKGESYEVNSFLNDEIRDNNISKTLILQFSKNSNKDIYLMRDVMSFIVSQIQFIYPEYNCVGVLI